MFIQCSSNWFHSGWEIERFDAVCFTDLVHKHLGGTGHVSLERRAIAVKGLAVAGDVGHKASIPPQCPTVQVAQARSHLSRLLEIKAIKVHDLCPGINKLLDK